MKLKSQSIKSVAYGTNQILKSIKYGNIKFSIVISADNTQYLCSSLTKNNNDDEDDKEGDDNEETQAFRINRVLYL